MLSIFEIEEIGHLSLWRTAKVFTMVTSRESINLYQINFLSTLLSTSEITAAITTAEEFVNNVCRYFSKLKKFC